MSAVVTAPSAGQDAARTRLFLLDGFRWVHDDQWVPVPRHVQRVVAAMGLHPGTARSYLAGLLWPDVTEGSARSRLRTGLWRLGMLPGCQVLTSGDAVRLHPQIVVDTDELVRAADDVTAGTELGRALGVLGAVRDGLLPGWYDDWVELERERLRQLRLRALERVARAMALAGDHGAAVQALLEALRAEPLRETPHRLLVQIHLAEGNVFEALQAFYSYRELLRRELRLEPSPAMLSLIDPILGSMHVRRDAQVQ